MLDTVGIKHYFRTLPCDDFKRIWRPLSKYKMPTWIYNAKGSKTLPNLTITNTPNGIYHLSAQVSLPKLLFGHNARLPNQDEVRQGMRQMAEYTEEISGLPFDAQTATVSLIHFAKDIQLTEPEVWKAIEKLSKKKLEPLRKNFYEDSTLYFTSKAKTSQIRIYPKFHAVLSEKGAPEQSKREARGKLRFEYCLLEKTSIDAIVKKLGLPDSKAQTLLTENVSDLVLSKLLEKLHFFELLSADKTNLEILLEHFPAKRAGFLDGFMNLVKLCGKDFFRDETSGFSKSSYSRNVRDCKKAKIW